MEIDKRFSIPQPWCILLTLGAIVLVAVFIPLERTLGANLRVVLVHGAWVWTGLVTFGLAGLSGLVALLSRQRRWHAWSLALGRTGLVFWLTYLPMSLLVMQLNWGGFFFDEPRWRVPFTFAVAGTLVQIALTLIQRDWVTSGVNTAFAVALWLSLQNIQSVLHPESPLSGTSTHSLQMFFLILLVLSLLISAQAAYWQRLHIHPDTLAD